MHLERCSNEGEPFCYPTANAQISPGGLELKLCGEVAGESWYGSLSPGLQSLDYFDAFYDTLLGLFHGNKECEIFFRRSRAICCTWFLLVCNYTPCWKDVRLR